MKRWWHRQFPLPLVFAWLIAATALTVASSLVPRPVYEASGLEEVRFGYPMPFLTQNRSSLAVDAHQYPVFVMWMDGGIPPRLEVGLALVNVAFYLVTFGLARVLLRSARDERNANRQGR
jgi:hypothetical protein